MIRLFYIMLLQADLFDQHMSFCGYSVYSAISSCSKGLGVFAFYSLKNESKPLTKMEIPTVWLVLGLMKLVKIIPSVKLV